MKPAETSRVVERETMIESRQQFLRRFVRMGSAGLVALMLIGAVGCGGEEDNGEDEEEDD